GVRVIGIVGRRVVVVVSRAHEPQRGHDPDEHHADDQPGWDARPTGGALALAAERGDRAHLTVRRTLVLALVLVDQAAAVKPQEVAVRPQEALDVDGTRQEVPFLVLDRPQVLGSDLRARLHLAHVDPGADPRFTQGGAD